MTGRRMNAKRAREMPKKETGSFFDKYRMRNVKEQRRVFQLSHYIDTGGEHYLNK